jgi:hypothetical protein
MKILLLCCILLTAYPLRAQDRGPVNILIPSFKSSTSYERIPGTIGKRTATILSLQLWKTLIKSSPASSNPFGRANFYLNLAAPPPGSQNEAVELARRQKQAINLVLWGKATEYGGGIVVESQLDITPDELGRRLGARVWEVIIRSGQKSYVFAADVPEWQYEFAPVVISTDVLPQLNNPAGLKMFSRPDMESTVLGYLGRGVKAEQHIGDYTYVLATASGRKGWIYLPNLSKSQSEVIDFTSGVIRVFRKDWNGALELLGKVVNNQITPSAIRVAAYLYMGLAADKLGDEVMSLQFLAEAHRLNPYSKAVAQYLCMGRLSALARMKQKGVIGAELRKKVEDARAILSTNAVLFAADDKWMLQVTRFLTEADRLL